jgi:ABC-type dipeptide/oligopeptide/nickel transport system ATPase component
MLQRGQLVMAFATPAEVLILDEVTSALDPTVCLQVLDAIVRLKEKRNAGILLITHDLCLAAEICDRVAVMQKGRIVETGPTPTIFDHPAHPYTQLLVTGMNADSGSEERVNNR